MLSNEGDDIVFDANAFLPSPSDWFSTNAEYEGWGRAEFSDPEGSVEGETHVSFDESGEATVEMRPDLSTVRADRELRFGLTELLRRRKAHAAARWNVLPILQLLDEQSLYEAGSNHRTWHFHLP